MVKFKKTKAVSGKAKIRLTILAKRIFNSGGDKRDRTAGLLNAIQALSQLSYTPVNMYKSIPCYAQFVKYFSQKKYYFQPIFPKRLLQKKLRLIHSQYRISFNTAAYFLNLYKQSLRISIKMAA